MHTLLYPVVAALLFLAACADPASVTDAQDRDVTVHEQAIRENEANGQRLEALIAEVEPHVRFNADGTWSLDGAANLSADAVRFASEARTASLAAIRSGAVLERLPSVRVDGPSYATAPLPNQQGVAMYWWGARISLRTGAAQGISTSWHISGGPTAVQLFLQYFGYSRWVAGIAGALLGLERDQKQLRRKHVSSSLSPLPLMEVALLQRMGRHGEAERHAKKASGALRGPEWTVLRRRVEYSLLQARSAVHHQSGAASEAHLDAALNAISVLRGQKAPEDAVGRCERRFLRFATECLERLPTTGILALARACFLRLLDSGGFRDCPALARRAAVAVVARGEPEKGERAAYEASFEFTLAPALLTVLLDRLHHATAVHLSKTLAEWSASIRDTSLGTALAQVLRLPAGQPDQTMLFAAWWRVLNDPAEVIDRLPDVLGKAGTPRSEQAKAFQEFTRVLVTALVTSKAAEDLLEEARRLGDLIPGEGPPSADSTAR